MSSQLEIIAIITPKAGKTDRVEELLTEVSEYVRSNEPDVLRYQVNREVNKKTGTEEIIMLETYKNKQALGAHGQSKVFKAFSKKLAEEDLVAGPPQLKFVKSVAGFSSRL
ncbi:hypothetical protein BP5796_08564 [Coleophoma crateriformis]|uniref:ABM domain-containing protein n=1 Tax=Coleophoma crateriformis TaxID=565419 RepID=A0A3D8R7Z4_9HELO|nr:hypothetical protein BP5796_08564 [Coleophoma crateriformis]